MGPHSRPAGFIFGARSACAVPSRLRPVRVRLGACAGVHFPRGERHDRLGGRQKPGRKVAPSSEGVL
jgi:hypothetical protein